MSDFSNIDKKIQEFKINKPGISIVDKPKSDWFIFQIRSIEWKKNRFNFIMEVFPDLDGKGSSIAWNFVAMIWFDENYIRHLAKYEFMNHSEFFVLEKYFINNLEEKYNYLKGLKEEKIPFKKFPISRT